MITITYIYDNYLLTFLLLLERTITYIYYDNYNLHIL